MAITYNAGTNTITVTGYTEGTPCTFTDIYNADVAGAWGVVTQQCTNQFCFTVKLIIGDGSTATWFKDIKKQILFNNVTILNNDTFFIIKANSIVIFGHLIDENNKITTDGINFLFNENTYRGQIRIDNNSSVDFYSCSFTQTNQKITLIHYPHRIWNCLTNILFESNYSGNFFNFIINNSQISNLGSACILKNLFMLTSQPCFFLPNTTTIHTLYARTTNLYSIIVNNLTNGDIFLIDVDINKWNILWSGTSTKNLLQQYEFNLKIIDKNNNPINGTIIKIWDKDNNLIVNTTTNVSGIISTEIITRGYYNQANGDTLQDKSPHIIEIKKSGYETYTTKFTLDKKTDWIIKLKKAKQLQIDINGNCYNILQSAKGTDSLLIKN